MSISYPLVTEAERASIERDMKGAARDLLGRGYVDEYYEDAADYFIDIALHFLNEARRDKKDGVKDDEDTIDVTRHCVLQPLPGENVSVFAGRLLKCAEENRTRAYGTFNGTTFYATRGDTLTAVGNRWFSKREEWGR